MVEGGLWGQLVLAGRGKDRLERRAWIGIRKDGGWCGGHGGMRMVNDAIVGRGGLLFDGVGRLVRNMFSRRRGSVYKNVEGRLGRRRGAGRRAL